MLNSLRIEGYALIDSLEISWKSGLTALTGETGSGKSIVLGALGLALGERADASVIRTGASRCVVEATFDVDMTEWLVAHDLDPEPMLHVRREVNANGRSRAFINDSPVAVGELKSLGILLVDLHGQDETRALADRARRIQLVDEVGQHLAECSAYELAFVKWQQALDALQELERQAQRPDGDLDYLSFQCAEIESLQLTNKNVEELQEEWNTLQHASAIRSDLLESAELLSSDQGNGDAITSLSFAVKALQRAAQHHPAAGLLAERMESLKVEAVELMRDLDHEVDRVQEDPEREQFLRNWLDEYQRLLTKHRLSSADGLLAKEAEMSAAIEAIQNRDERISELKASVEAAFSQVSSAGKALREVRKTTTKQLEENIVHQLGQLKMKDASLQVVWTEMGAPDAWGLDDVEWLFRSHPTSSFQPLTQVASGGERSRLMLAIKAVQSHHAAPKTIILDEIDTGVSGHVAECMARLMREMSAHQQVISVTHLPQVAGIADHHLQVTKNASTDKVETRVEQLTPDARIQEIAAMLSGAEITPAALQHAEALLASRSV